MTNHFEQIKLSVDLPRSAVWAICWKWIWIVPQTAYVCRCTVTFLTTPKTVRRTARVCSLNLEKVATPKTVCWPTEVCSFRCLLQKLSIELQRSAVLNILISFYSENCPLTFQGLQFFVKKWKKCSLLRKLSVDLPPFAVWGPVRWPATVGSLNRSYFSGSNCQGLQVYGQFHKLQLVAGVPKCNPSLIKFEDIDW